MISIMWNDKNLLNLVKILKGGGVIVMPTDTIYGIVGSALSVPAANRIYALRKRNPDKPCVILISHINELEKFSIKLSKEQKNKIKEYWSNNSTPVSIILDCPEESFSYLHRGTQTLAFRVPALQELRDLLLEVGPLIAPSANLEGLSPAHDINEAKKYFGLPAQAGDSVDLYIDGGEISGKASKVIKLNNDGSVFIIRN